MATAATGLTISLQVDASKVWPTPTLNGTFSVDANPNVIITWNTSNVFPRNATLSASIPFGFLNAGVHNFAYSTDNFSSTWTFGSGVLPTPTQLVLNSTPNTIGAIPAQWTNPLPSGPIRVFGNQDITVLCLHGSSLIKMREGTKRIDEIQPGDEVLSGKNLDEYIKVKTVPKCWLSFLGVDHDAIIFEKNSLGPNQPEEQLIIDPGHPICTKEQYLENGYESFRPAGSYWEELKGDKIYTKKWTDIYVQEEPSIRYDLVLEGEYNNYVANGLVVESAGYKDHRYKEFV